MELTADSCDMHAPNATMRTAGREWIPWWKLTLVCTSGTNNRGLLGIIHVLLNRSHTGGLFLECMAVTPARTSVFFFHLEFFYFNHFLHSCKGCFNSPLPVNVLELWQENLNSKDTEEENVCWMMRRMMWGYIPLLQIWLLCSWPSSRVSVLECSVRVFQNCSRVTRWQQPWETVKAANDFPVFTLKMYWTQLTAGLEVKVISNN